MTESILRPGLQRQLRWIIVGLVLLHLGKTILFSSVGQPPLVGDAVHYWGCAQRVASGDWLMVKDRPEILRTPGYPWFLALLQLGFGRFAMAAAVVCQQAMIFATAMITAGMCQRLTRSSLGAVIGLGLAACCISQNSIALHIFSEPLFTLLLTSSVALLVVWLDRPDLRVAAAAGLLLGAAALVRPIAQWACVPVLLTMAWRLWPLRSWRQQASHFACFVAMLAVLWIPWYARNSIYCGKPYFTRTAGLTMWGSTFQAGPEDPLNPGLGFADTPETQRLKELVEGENLHSQWGVFKKLQERGYTEDKAIDMMQTVCQQAIMAHPWRFVDSRLRRIVWFWVTPNGTFRPLTPEFHLRVAGGTIEDVSVDQAPGLEGTYAGQSVWHWDGYFVRGQLNWLWHPNPWAYLGTLLLTLGGLIFMIRRRRFHIVGVALALLLAYFAAATAIGAPPEYRYRMPLEPIMILAIASGIVNHRDARTYDAR